MTLQEADQSVGASVVYRPHPRARAEDGEIVRVNAAYVFVLFVGDRAPKACHPADLELS